MTFHTILHKSTQYIGTLKISFTFRTLGSLRSRSLWPTSPCLQPIAGWHHDNMLQTYANELMISRLPFQHLFHENAQDFKAGLCFGSVAVADLCSLYSRTVEFTGPL